MVRTLEIVSWLKEHAPSGAMLRVDSRAIQKGDVFFAIVGSKVDGRKFIPQALANGASCIVLEKGEGPEENVVGMVPELHVRDLSSILGRIASVYYGAPSSQMLGVAVTGTNGKTTSVNWISQILNNLGVDCASIGTLGCYLKGQKIPSISLTTPDPLGLQTLFYELRQTGAKAFAMEASSIGLEQGRIDGTELKVAAFTNLTRDHLDYHGTMLAYQKAKELLFGFPGLKSAVINLDDEAAGAMQQAAMAHGLNIIGLSSKGNAEAQFAAIDIDHEKEGLSFTVSYKNESRRFNSGLIGLFNIDNFLLAIGCCVAAGFEFERVCTAAENLKPPKGRMQKVSEGFSPMVLVDYAHTPDAIEKALGALEDLAKARRGKIWIVVGAGGDRDHGKRKPMGQAASLADVTILTSDNPRTEDPAAILSEVAEGAKPEARLILDRAEAIRTAIMEANPEDIVLIAGKGHEDYQEIDGVKHHFSDEEKAQQALKNRKEQ